MFHIFCSLEHASHLINDIPFKNADGGVITVDPVSAEVAAMFKGIGGFEIRDAGDAKKGPATGSTQDASAEKRGRGRPTNAEKAAAAALAAGAAATAQAPIASEAGRAEPPATSADIADDESEEAEAEETAESAEPAAAAGEAADEPRAAD